MKTAILTSTLLSLSLLTVNLSAGKNMVCKDGKCFIDLSHLDDKVKKSKVKKNLFNYKDIRKKRTLDERIEKIVLDKSKYIKQANEILKPLSKSEIATVILAPEKYIMTALELEKYEVEHIELTLLDEDTKSKIIKKSKLPTSEYFCEKNQKLIYQKLTDSFECA
jgi:hypothetical protein